jgi:hypothetical protein
VCVAAVPALGQGLPQRPLTWLGGRLVVQANASVATATTEHNTYFNDGDYGQDTMGLVQFGLFSTLSLHERAVVVADLGASGEPDGSGWYLRPRSLVLRVRPFSEPALALSAGLLQPSFGTVGRRGYGRENLLIGRPLIYQYSSTLRADAVPVSADELLANRGLGSRASYAIDYRSYYDGPSGGTYYAGSSDGTYYDGPSDGTYYSYGLPLVDPTGWNLGVEVTAGKGPLQASASLTDGSVSNRRSRGLSGGWQAAGRVEAVPMTGLVVGASVASGRYLDSHLLEKLPAATANPDPTERAFGVDVEYSRDYWILRWEVVHGRRTVPALASPFLSDPLTVTGIDVEGRYRLAPGLYAAARVGRLAFGDVAGSTATASWDADVTRVEAGVGWSLSRGIVLKAAHQYNRRDLPGRLRSANRTGAEILVWF